MTKETAIKLLKQWILAGKSEGLRPGTSDLAVIVKEMEEKPKWYPPLFRIDEEFPETEPIADMCAREYRPKCSWCNDYLQSKHPFHDGKGEYCSVACMLTNQDHEKIAKLVEWQAKIDRGFYPR
jgi:hypothetical protein